jgi:ABC-type branched-subunit amino acid transport system substrate-binding protein
VEYDVPPTRPEFDVDPRTAVIGVLLSSSLGHELAGDHLLAGLALGLRRAPSLDTTVRTARTTEDDVPTAATRLIDDGAEIIVAGVTHPTVAGLADLCRDRGVALVVAGLGGHVQEQRLPGVLHCTQQQWQASYVMGAWAARHLDGDLFQIVAASHAEDDSVDALQSGFMSVAGSVVGRATTHQRPDANEVDDAVLAAWVSGAGTVAVHASGQCATDIVRAVRSTGLPVDLVVDGLGAEDFALAELDRGVGGIFSASSWCRADAGAFGQDFRTATGDAADPFAAVGYDVAVLLIEAARRLGHDRPWSLLADVLSGSSVTGARGRMTVDVETGSANTPIVVRRSRANRNVVVARRPLVSAPPPTMAFTMVGRSPVSYSDEVTDA